MKSCLIFIWHFFTSSNLKRIQNAILEEHAKCNARVFLIMKFRRKINPNSPNCWSFFHDTLHLLVSICYFNDFVTSLRCHHDISLTLQHLQCLYYMNKCKQIIYQDQYFWIGWCFNFLHYKENDDISKTHAWEEEFCCTKTVLNKFYKTCIKIQSVLKVMPIIFKPWTHCPPLFLGLSER